ncbi:MAG: phosphatidate cytidylyltransferase [Actinomycetales bacterium]
MADDNDPAQRPPSPAMPVPTGAKPADPQAAARRAQDTASSTVTSPGGPKTPKAGRNLPAAIAVGVGLGALCLITLFWRRELFAVLLMIAVAQGIRELVTSLRSRQLHVPMIPLQIGSVGMAVSAFVGGPQAMFYAFVLTCLAVLAWKVLDAHGGATVRDAAAGVFVAAYVPYLAGFAVLMLAEPDGQWRIVTMIAIPVFSDIGGYIFGVLWGKHPMAPSVSPKKSWEGLAGSLLFGVLTGVVCVVFGINGPWWAGVIVGICAVITGVLGDLSESLLKRDLGIKDMGDILPGHGGVLDRIDSLLPTAPVMYLLLAILAPAGLG